MKANLGRKTKSDPQPSVFMQIKSYSTIHPGSPAAVRHPQVVLDGGRYVALLGSSIERGIIGFGSSVASALHAFDDLYANFLRPPHA